MVLANMTERLTDEQIAADRAIIAAATAPPWIPCGGTVTNEKELGHFTIEWLCNTDDDRNEEADGQFIAASRTRWPIALDACEHLLRENERLAAQVAQLSSDRETVIACSNKHRSKVEHLLGVLREIRDELSRGNPILAESRDRINAFFHAGGAVTDRIVTLLAQQKESQIRDAVESVINALARLVFTIQLKELEIKVESDPAATEAEKTATARVLSDDTVAARLLSRRFAEEWRKEATAAADHSLADLRAECPGADISGDLAFFDGLEAAIALVHAKVKACNAKMLAQAMPKVPERDLAKEALADIAAKGEPMRPGGNPTVSQEALDEINAMPSIEPPPLVSGERILEPPDMREIRELGADPCDLDMPTAD
jgi:hypothetical protein